MVLVVVKGTSTEDMNEAFKEKDEKYREWATRETREKKVMVVMVPLIISHDGSVHVAQSGAVRTSQQTSLSIGSGLPRMCSATTWSSSESSSIRASGSRGPGGESTRKSLKRGSKINLRELKQAKKGTPPPNGVRLTSPGRETSIVQTVRTNQQRIETVQKKVCRLTIRHSTPWSVSKNDMVEVFDCKSR